MKIFISHSNEGRKFTDKLKDNLISAGHSPVFLDENISLGDTPFFSCSPRCWRGIVFRDNVAQK